MCHEWASVGPRLADCDEEGGVAAARGGVCVVGGVRGGVDFDSAWMVKWVSGEGGSDIRAAMEIAE